MTRPKALDLCCGAGGVSRGLADAGFDVTGVDLALQPRYPYPFIQADALTLSLDFLRQFALVWASWPCQAFTSLRQVTGKTYPDLITPGRALLCAAGRPYIMENVPGAPLHSPILLCGQMFGLKVYRHRLFESNYLLLAPSHVPHRDRTPRAGRAVTSPKGFITVAGHIGLTAYARAAMGIDWMTRDELAQAIPPAYSAYLGRQLLRACADAA
jgi:DNA (cytosine-5)-methyltransferase 1